MNALCKALADDIPVRTRVEIEPLQTPRELSDTHGNALGRFDWIVSTAPGPQTVALFRGLAPIALSPDHMTGSFTTMLGFAQLHDPGWDMAEVDDPIIASIIVNSAKPGRGRGGAAFVIHTRSDWAEPRLDEAPDAVQPLFADAFTRITGIDAGKADYATAHRWRYAHANAGVEDGFVLAPDIGLGACGDWFNGGGVEGAFNSAGALADRLLA